MQDDKRNITLKVQSLRHKFVNGKWVLVKKENDNETSKR
jgi:hypothetical protein